jgi:hypothetical protein
MDGQGCLIARTPSTLFPINSCQRFNFFCYNASKQLTFPEIGSMIAISIPKKGTVAEPGFVSIAPGKGVMTMDPVSVCLIAYHKDTNH